MLQQRIMWIVWPAFLVAGVLEILVFAFIDPSDLRWSGVPLEWSRQAVYTFSFFLFWAVTAVASALTTLLSMSPFEVNRCPLPKEGRPVGCGKHESCQG